MKEQDRDSILRQMTLEILIQTLEKDEYSHIAIRNVLNKADYLETKDKAFVKRLAEGTLERLIEIDYILNTYSKVKVNKMKPVVRNILRMGVYQILFMDGVYDTQACNEAVKLTAKKGLTGLKGYVNGVLRSIVREKEKISYPGKETGTLYYSVKYSVPEWLVKMWQEQYSEEVTEKILQSQLEQKAVTIRFDEHLSVQRKEELLKQIEEKTRNSLIESPYLAYAYTMKGTDNVTHLPGFAEGEIIIQDVASMLVAEVADLKGNECILDVCAAPGGKTMHLASKLHGTGSIEARDLSEKKVSQIKENIDKYGAKNITCRVYDATQYDSEWVQKADVVIADLPCSGLGVIGKKNDIKLRVTPEQLEELAKLQRKILAVVQSYVKPGGILIYSTCTVNRAENDENAAWFEQQFPFERENVQPFLPKMLKENVGTDKTLQLLPGVTKCDGFYIARFKRLPDNL